MDRLFFDTNVLLDVLEERAPWFPEAVECLARVRSDQCRGATTAITLSDIAYIQRATDSSRVYSVFQRLREFLEVATLDAAVVDASLRNRLPDIEDGFQYQAAIAWGATHLLSRNVKDFPSDGLLKVESPADYLAHRRV